MKHIISARRFSNIPTFYEWDTAHRFPCFEIVEEITIEIDVPDLNSAYMWLLKTIPTHAIGCGIRNENGDFMFAPSKTTTTSSPTTTTPKSSLTKSNRLAKEADFSASFFLHPFPLAKKVWFLKIKYFCQVTKHANFSWFLKTKKICQPQQQSKKV